MKHFLRRLVRDRTAMAGLILLTILVLAAVSAPLLTVDPAEVRLDRRLMPPSWEALFGTDRLGRDILTNIAFGAGITLLIAGVTVTIGVLIGVPIGLVAGYYRSWVSDALMRIADVVLAIPQIVLAIAITQTLGPSIESIILALSLTHWPFWTRLVYGETRSVRNEIFVEAAVALGVPSWRIMILHILPAIASSIVVRTSIAVGATILAGATLGFLGLGAPPPTPEWGRMIAESREYLPEAWWYPLAPGMAIFLTVLGSYLFGDGLRDILDPRTRQPLP
jgi:peptide/nickel transport system permease protein